MPTASTSLIWNGKLEEGKGTMGFIGYEGNYTFASRFEGRVGSNPEELVGEAHDGCLSMFLSFFITNEGLNPESMNPSADLTITNDGSGPAVPDTKLTCQVKCNDLYENKLKELTAITKGNCVASRFYFGITANIKNEAQLIKI